MRLHEDPAADIPALCRDVEIPAQVGQRASRELIDAGQVTVVEIAEGAPEHLVTSQGEDVVRRLVAERHASLARRCDGWSPEQNPELNQLLLALARDLARKPSPEVTASA